MNTPTVSVVCMKWGTKYGPQYVNRLYNMVSKNLSLPFDFYCITDNDKGLNPKVITKALPQFQFPVGAKGPWQKVLMFKGDLFGIKGKVMFLDLDIIIVNPIDKFFSYSDKFAVRHEFEKSKETKPYGNTSVYVFEAGAYPYIYNNYFKDQNRWHNTYGTAEQEYVTRSLFNDDNIEFFPNDWIVSFKEHCLPKLPMRYWQTPSYPDSASIVAFHGRPFPEDALKGDWPLDGKSSWKKVYKFTRPCPWVSSAWK